MKIIEREFYYEFELDSSVKLIYTKKPFDLSVRDISSDNLSFIPKNKKIKYLKQLHTNVVYNVSDDFVNFQEGDGLVSFSCNVALLTYHADCLPIYIFDKSKKYIGLAHSGYKGTFKLVILKMLLMFESMGSDFQDLKVVFGPYNRSCCYEISLEFFEKVNSKFSKKLLDMSFCKKDDKIYFDNANFNLGLISNFNLDIEDSGLCTYCSYNLYSYRKSRGKRSYASIWRT
ncbi:peptidoglycan editing factor PgeF [Borrelia miyamotoi]|uniref:Purine nucleoside phosphorylase n=1 Tax=Borrelia miyamotoi TaxID=47466 RepID=A0AAQ3AGI6_9SPIR|nr:peptidoglycan editing factor PgeF [Borrelia miyamotoi]AGT27443.1 laccase-type protein [Borrelia miyamotoi LB-2001]AJA58616.1 laccase [Borrelia miyamotoi]AOW95696.1 laccase [Borrelia miyamotoi]QTL83580.1 peptidoglycan editing factor PgeF [Borrelia miyamotoi]WAZ85119.1 peptidoglycan editing factor PgeF [Borrelia miyamotoi]